MKNIFDSYFLTRFDPSDDESRFQAKALLVSHFSIAPLMIFVILVGHAEPIMMTFMAGIVAMNVFSVLLIRRGKLTVTTMLTYSGIGLFASLIVFGRTSYNVYEPYFLATVHMFIILVSSLLTRQRFYTFFTTGMAILYIILLFLFRGINMSTPVAPLMIDDYGVSITLVILTGIMLLSSKRRREELLDIAEQEGRINKEKSEALAKSLAEKEILLNEIHHRVKNNLNVAISLLRMQSNQTGQPKGTRQALQDSIHRLHSMALVHERLYKSGDFSAIEFQPYILSVLNTIIQSYHKRGVSFDLDIRDNLTIGLDRAVPCGLILNELLTNVFKHAFNDGESGKATVIFKQENGEFVLSVQDNGKGTSEEEWNNSHSLGAKVVRLLTEQLEGELQIDGDQGTTITISFPIGQA